MSRYVVGLQLAASLLLLGLGGAALVVELGRAEGTLVPAAGLLAGGVSLAWGAVRGVRGRHRQAPRRPPARLGARPRPR